MGSFLNVLIYRLPSALLALASEEDMQAEEVAIPQSLFQRLLWALHYLGQDVLWMGIYLFRELPRELSLAIRSISFPASHCVHCQRPIAWYDNLPVLSWFLLKGRCRFCGKPFSVRYAFNELVCGLIFVYVFDMTGFHWDFLAWAFFVSMLWSIFWIDLDHQLIFNVITYPSILLGIVYNVSKGLVYQGLWGLAFGFVLFQVIVFLSIVLLQKEGMGGGDVRLAMMLGAWLGPIKLAAALALAFIIGSLVGIVLLIRQRQSKPFSFGPALVLGGLIAMRLGEILWTWYINSIYGNSLTGLI